MIKADWFDEPHIVACPTTLDGALAFLAEQPAATIVAGATDLGVRINKTGRLPAAILDLNRIEELRGVRIENDTIICGAGTTWSDLLTLLPTSSPLWGGMGRGSELDTSAANDQPYSASSTALTEFARILQIFGAPQIRHVGTIAGNIANASPIADSLPFLFIMEATLTLARLDPASTASAVRSATREININSFYHGYKQFDLRPGELITEVRIPLPQPDDLIRLYKVSRRRDLDISSLTAAIRLRLGDDTDQIIHASIALGAVGPTVLRGKQAEQFLINQPFTEQTMQAAADIAVSEITPITDVRGAANYRRQLVKNIFRKFYHQHVPQTV
jgi:xanthine dehydrogenase small subunit